MIAKWIVVVPFFVNMCITIYQRRWWEATYWFSGGLINIAAIMGMQK